MGRKYLSVAVSKKTREEAEKALCGDATTGVVTPWNYFLFLPPEKN
jgi:hypothetical protein